MPSPAPGLSRGLAWGIAVVATLTMSVSYIDRTALSVLAPTVTHELGISESNYGWIASAFSMAYLFGTPLGGALIDRVGARRGLVASILAWSTVAALHALAPGFGALFALRIALGLAEGPSFPGSAQTMQRALPPGERSRGLGLLFTGSSLGAMVAAPMASYLYKVAGWRFAFLGTAAAGLVWLPLWIALTSRSAAAAQLDTAGPAETPKPRVPMRELASHPIMVRALVAIFAVAPIMGMYLGWGSKFLVRRFGLGQEQVGGYLWLPPLVFDLACVTFGDLSARQRRAPGAPPRALLAVGALFACGLALLPWADTPWLSIAVLCMGQVGVASTYTLVTADMLSRMPARSASSAAGIIAGAQSLALIISSPLIGRAVERYHSYDLIALALGAWAVPGCLIWWAWQPAERFEERV